MVKKIVFWRVWIITFKVRSLAQSDQTRRVITTFTPFDQVSSRYHLFFPLFFDKISILRKNCGTRFFEVSSLLFFFLSFFSFFFFALGFTSFWKLVACTQSSERPQELHTRLLPTYRSAIKYWFSFTSMTMIRRHRGLVFWQKFIGHRTPVQTEKGPRVSRSSARKRWLEGMVGETRLPDEFETSLTILVCPWRGRVVSGSIL